MLTLPKDFVSRARAALGDEAEEFFASYENKPQKGIRVNSLKISAEEFKKISPFNIEPIAWEENGFYVEEEKVGSHPYHAAGLYYSQEPSAMFPVSLVEIPEGARALDLCSAPGGKGTQLAQKMRGEGIIVLNEYVPQRAKILSQNVERLGIKNAVVINESPEKLEGVFKSYFDVILVDAPCSGEGMFKKNAEEALDNWSVENVLSCARRQKAILSSAAKMLAGGGKIVYSTCTFSPEEDENLVADFLTENGDFILEREEKLLPHKIRGEGHYVALLRKEGGERLDKKCVKTAKEDKDIRLYRSFEEEFINVSFKNLFRAGDFLYSLPAGIFSLEGLKVLRAGVRLGEYVNGRFEPSHSLAMSLKREEIKNFVSLPLSEADKYLRGETFPADGARKGRCVVGVENFPLGLGKISGGIVKNHYPKGLRIFK